MVDWLKKLKALLHDPPYKQFVWNDEKRKKINKSLSIAPHRNDPQKHELHEIWAEELLNYIFCQECIKDNDVNRADRLASAQSRIIVKPSFND
ncbi:MAG: hypothetical protein ACP5P0_05900, partial [Hydrogenobacter sp.]